MIPAAVVVGINHKKIFKNHLKQYLKILICIMLLGLIFIVLLDKKYLLLNKLYFLLEGLIKKYFEFRTI